MPGVHLNLRRLPGEKGKEAGFCYSTVKREEREAKETFFSHRLFASVAVKHHLLRINLGTNNDANSGSEMGRCDGIWKAWNAECGVGGEFSLACEEGKRMSLSLRLSLSFFSLPIFPLLSSCGFASDLSSFNRCDATHIKPGPAKVRRLKSRLLYDACVTSPRVQRARHEALRRRQACTSDRVAGASRVVRGFRGIRVESRHRRHPAGSLSCPCRARHEMDHRTWWGHDGGPRSVGCVCT
ncbi:hypothetical protein B296_00010133 [Ensete ventricosum]|uniref:Uncharacterized protein n=1 Tax=Ensete ventricosum TaxID=4639 RepID=A0A426ZF53_ENSVE|nr:hypothetical protein B296_00010133 [Ensete ventricosum]